MNPSPLQLERHFFTKVLVEAHADGKPDVPTPAQCEVELGRDAEHPKRFQVVMRLKLLSPQKNTPCYTAEVHAVGVFRVQEGWPEERIVELVEANGAALLYGATRELLCSLTSRGPWPMLSLAAVTFIRPKMEKSKALAKKTEKTETSGAEKRS